MPKRAFNVTIVVENNENNDDAPVPGGEVLTSLLMHRNFEVTEVVTSESKQPIITIREVPKP